jgi:hypothetical protein
MAQGGDKKPTPEDKGKGKAPNADTNGVHGVNGLEDSKKELPGKILKDGEKPEIGEEWYFQLSDHKLIRIHSCRGTVRGGPEAEERARHAGREDSSEHTVTSIIGLRTNIIIRRMTRVYISRLWMPSKNPSRHLHHQ